ncbi:ABC transporter permease [Fibrobacter sp. UWEL]|uniref:ABC transporter permease n=1 Tax=Fibrobacter sp. UWEL TaxID=1896209 RepID=UPI0011607941|nr:ABC transporter permease [Fibrobacter sp. UWEL]
MFLSFFRTIRTIYFGHNLVMWLVILILPIATSVFMVDVFSAEILQHIPIGVIKQDRSQLADELEEGFRANPVVDVAMVCSDFSECEHAVVKGELQAFVLLPYDLERRALRFETPVIPVYSSGQNYLTNSFATKEIRTVISSIGANLFTKGMNDPVKVSLQSVGNSTGNYQGFLGMGLVTAIFHLACILAAVYMFSLPFRDHRVREYLAAAGGSRAILGLATIIPLGIIQSMAMVGVYAYTHRFMAPMTLDEFIITASGQVAMVFACNGAGAAFVAITGNMRFGTSVAGVIAGPAFAFAGQTFPIMAMPFAVRCFAFCLPLTHVLKVQSSMLLGEAGKAHAWESIVILMFMALFWHLLATRLFFIRWKVAAKREKEWSLQAVNILGEAVKE